LVANLDQVGVAVNEPTDEQRLEHGVAVIVRVRPLETLGQREIFDHPPHPSALPLDVRLRLRELTADPVQRSHHDVRVSGLYGLGSRGADWNEAVVTLAPGCERVPDPADPTRCPHSGLQLSSGSGACRVAMS